MIYNQVKEDYAMLKNDLIDKIAEKTNMTKRDVEVVCEALKDTIIV